MPDNLTNDRWVEVQFYFICTDLLKLRNNIMDVMDIIDALAVFGGYSPEQIKPLAQEAIASLRFRPNRDEVIILCHIMKIPTMQIKSKTSVHNRIMYDILAAEKKNPRLFYPRMRPEQTALIRQFVDSFNNFRKVGLFC